MSDIKAKFDELLEKQRALKAEFQVAAQAMFKETFKEFWALNPAIKLVRWTQYTPYFNDGDTCEFSVNDVYFSNAEGDEADNICSYGEYDGEDESVWSENAYAFATDRSYYKEFQDKLVPGTYDTASIVALSNLIQSADMTEIMEVMFEDHVCVTATRDGFDVSEYSHD